ncbi:Trimeric GatFAB AmidoTransferase(AdT) complex subunit [Orbilia ellipsospora]|uniref:Glutamyl-tRNA(Gln) amidotransferase subunit A, mitochondrial n=2 Tax=Orbilia ellipsospora TaxID=2528407 RepID=A0AAV9XP34_9PEZI
MTSAVLREATKCLRVIKEKNDFLNAFVPTGLPTSNGPETSLSLESPRPDKPRSQLDGLTFAVKDNICIKGTITTCASRMLTGFTPEYDATVVKKLKECGAIILGKTNMDEFGMGSHSTFSHFGPTKHPSSTESSIYSAGGSSGGSAAAVASGMCFGALGSDTGGSIRLPASYCGVIGFKPSYGLLSRHGLVTYANSLDSIGIFAKDVHSTRLIFDCLSEHDATDPTSLDTATRKRIGNQFQSLRSRSKRCWKIGIPIDYNVHEISRPLRKAWINTLAALRDLGHSIIPVKLNSTRHAISSYYIIALAEAASNLAKYDGVRFGFAPRTSMICNLGEILTSLNKLAMVRDMGFGREVRRRILLGNYSLTSRSFQNYFIHAQKIRRLIQQDFDEVFALPNPLRKPLKSYGNSFNRADVLVSPVSVSIPPSLESVLSSENLGLDSYINDVFTIPASMAGLPSISIPIRDARNELPLGLQVIAQYGDENGLFDIANIIQQIRGSVGL